MIALALASLLLTPGAEGGRVDAALAAPSGFSLQRVQYYTRPPPYSYRKYYAYKNNTAPAPAHPKKPAKPKH